MAPPTKKPTDAAFLARLSIADREILAALRKAMREESYNQADVARATNLSENTVVNYMHERTPVSVRRVLAAPQRLAKAFRRALCSAHHEPLPYVARKRRSGK